MCKRRLLKTNAIGRSAGCPSFAVTAACRTLLRQKVAFALSQKWASNNQFRSMAAGTVVGRYQSYFLICPVGSWDFGATDTVPAAPTINGTHSSGNGPSRVLVGRSLSHTNPSPHLLVRLSPAPLFLFIVRTGGYEWRQARLADAQPFGTVWRAFIFFPCFE